MKVVRSDEVEPIPVVGGELQWRPLRRRLGIGSFGINPYTADAAELIVEEHDETGAGAGHHEELYVVGVEREAFTRRPRHCSSRGSSYTRATRACSTTSRASRP